jgi:soluble lytic murein transglycosylase-like protein
MIEKIDARAAFAPVFSNSRSPGKDGNRDFHSILKGSMEGFAPLERIALEFLKRAVESAFSTEEMGQDDLFTLPPLLLPVRPETRRDLLQGAHPAEMDSNSVENAPEPRMSNNSPAARDFEPIIRDAGNRYGVDPALIRAVIQAESGGDPLAVSRAGARGLMQLMPGTAAELSVGNAFDPVENIMGGTRYLSRLLDRYRGDVKLALAAYNWGMGNLEKRPESIPRETKNYITKVESQYRNASEV